MKAQQKTVVVGVTGSIAAYKAAELVRLFQQRGVDVWVMMTESATQYVGPLTFHALTNHPVARGRFEVMDESTYQHLDLSGRADAMLIAPCTANMIAKMACGLADDVVSATVLAARGPVFVAPAMNERMWLNAATKANVAVLKKRGVQVLDVERGHLACGDTGSGRLCRLDKIVAAVMKELAV